MPRFDSSLRIFSEFEMTKPFSPKATVRRCCCCASLMLLDGSYTGCVALATPAQNKESRNRGFPRYVNVVWKSRFFKLEVPPPVCCLSRNSGPSEALTLFLLRHRRRDRK